MSYSVIHFFSDDAAHDDTLLAEWFDVVNQKNKLVRREGELIAQ